MSMNPTEVSEIISVASLALGLIEKYGMSAWLTLKEVIEHGNSITQTGVSALQTDFLSFETCWAGLKTGTTPDACAALGGSK